jgi:hypothetical protein
LKDCSDLSIEHRMCDPLMGIHLSIEREIWADNGVELTESPYESEWVIGDRPELRILCIEVDGGDLGARVRFPPVEAREFTWRFESEFGFQNRDTLRADAIEFSGAPIEVVAVEYEQRSSRRQRVISLRR